MKNIRKKNRIGSIITLTLLCSLLVSFGKEKLQTDEAVKIFHEKLNDQNVIILKSDLQSDNLAEIYFDIRHNENYSINFLSPNTDDTLLLNSEKIIFEINQIFTKNDLLYPLGEYVYRVSYNGVKNEFKFEFFRNLE